MIPKFRVWDEDEKRMVYPADDNALIIRNGKFFLKERYDYESNQYNEKEIEPENVMLSADLQDRNKKEVYDKDFLYSIVLRFDLWLVLFEQGEFRFYKLDIKGPLENAEKAKLKKSATYRRWEEMKSCITDYEIYGNISERPGWLEREGKVNNESRQ